MSRRIVWSGTTGRGGGGEGDGERALAGFVERGLAEEAGLAAAEDGFEAPTAGGAGDDEEAGPAVAAAGSADGAGEGEWTRTGMEMESRTPSPFEMEIPLPSWDDRRDDVADAVCGGGLRWRSGVNDECLRPSTVSISTSEAMVLGEEEQEGRVAPCRAVAKDPRIIPPPLQFSCLESRRTDAKENQLVAHQIPVRPLSSIPIGSAFPIFQLKVKLPAELQQKFKPL